MLDGKIAPKDFGFREDEAMLRDTARKVLTEKLPTDGLRRLVADSPEPVYDEGVRAPWNTRLWSEIVELGWTGLAIDEASGGSDVSMVGIAGIVEEIGRAALPSPLIPTLSASLLLRRAGGDVAKRVLAAIVGEGAAASLALTNPAGSWEPADAPLMAREAGADLILSGTAHFVQDAFKVAYLIASARHGDSIVLCVVPTDAPGLTLEQDHIHDLTRDQATVHFEDVRIGSDAIVSRDAAEVLDATWPAFLTLVAADLCGAAEWLLQTTVAYAKDRVQFDRPIGFFQAVKHPLVNAMVEIDRARSLLYHAAAEFNAGSPEAETAARMAKSAASDAAAFMSSRAIQLHGGIGFTWECALHIYFKRNLNNQALYGDGVYQRQKLAEILMGPIGAACSEPRPGA
jgi:alkylation response protein AidB-like acyl-CoA dehydrogenase